MTKSKQGVKNNFELKFSLIVSVTNRTGLASILLDLTISGRVLDEGNQVPLSLLDSKFQKK